jgi:peptidoglycan/LPS O-acetylase OafA/YrhL
MGNSTRLGYVDMLRAVAAISVVITHVLERTTPGFHDFRFSTFDFGCFGVSLFFLCSGFVIPRSIERSESVGGGVVRFWTKRLLRLYPAYWVSVLLIAGCYVSGLARPPHDVTVDAPRTLVQLSMLQYLFGQPNFLVVYWTLNYELLFYLLVSLLFAARMLRHTAPIVMMLTVASALFDAALPALGSVPLHLGLLSFLATMFIGTLVHRWRSGDVPGGQVAAIIGLNLLTLCAVSYAVGLREGNPGARLSQVTGYVAGLAVFLATVLWEPRRIPAWLLWLGAISYPIYLLHPIVLAVVPQAASVPIAWLVWAAVTIPASAACHVFVERPGMELGERLSAALTGPRGGHAPLEPCHASPKRSAAP